MTSPTTASTSSLAAVLDGVTARLADAGVPSARADAETLVALALDMDRGSLGRALAAGQPVADGALPAIDQLVRRRATREPLQHITGTAGFRYLDIAVGPGVFVPRPETELVAGAAIDAARAAGGKPLVVDLCAGSAAIALAVATEVPGAEVHAVEREHAALEWARRNITAVASGVRLHHADVADALSELTGRVDVVVSNPPYVPDDERGAVAPEVLRDPDPALWGGPDGLDTIRVVARTAARLLRPATGVLVMEHADRHGAAVPDLLRADGAWTDVVDHADLAGRPRFVTARRRP